jgi:uncharacterized RDD family membrane protein YckC
MLTPENMEVRFRLAGLATRFFAWAFDAFLQVLLLGLILQAFAFTIPIVLRSSLGKNAANWVIAIMIILFFLVLNGYFIFFELKWRGQTPGKMLLHIRVIKQDGYPIGLVESLVRNLVRILDWVPFLYAVGALSMLLSRQSRRLGDLAAGTIVVREDPPIPKPLDLPPKRERYPEAKLLGTDYLDLIHNFQMRSQFLNRPARTHIAGSLARIMARSLGTEFPPGRSSEGYLADLLRSASEENPDDDVLK